MNYITNYYKNLCEQRQEKIFILQKLLEMEEPIPTVLNVVEPAEPPAPAKQNSEPQTPNNLPQIPTKIPSWYPQFPQKPFGMSDEDYQKLLKAFKPFGNPIKLQEESPNDYGPIYEEYLKNVKNWIEKMMQDMKQWVQEYSQQNPKPEGSTSSTEYAKWFNAMYQEQQKALGKWYQSHKFPSYSPPPPIVK